MLWVRREKNFHLFHELNFVILQKIFFQPDHCHRLNRTDVLILYHLRDVMQDFCYRAIGRDVRMNHRVRRMPMISLRFQKVVSKFVSANFNPMLFNN
jgi:hypothetical protein